MSSATPDLLLVLLSIRSEVAHLNYTVTVVSTP